MAANKKNGEAREGLFTLEHQIMSNSPITITASRINSDMITMIILFNLVRCRVMRMVVIKDYNKESQPQP